MKFAKEFKDYEILEMNCGYKKERWGKYILVRPDPQVIWEDKLTLDNVDAYYHRSDKGGGYWEYLKEIKDSFIINYKDLKFNVKLMGFKHTGIFPEQSVNWEIMTEKIKNSKRKVKILNLFGYTGCATVALLKAGASVVHVDSSSGVVALCKENVVLNNLQDKDIRYIVEDVRKFVQREIRRGNKYDGVLMDPPSFGRGKSKEVWDINKDLFNLVKDATEILSDDPLFFIINTYTTGLSKTVLEDILNLTVNKKYKGKVESYEIGLLGKNNLVLPCGETGKWEKI